MFRFILLSVLALIVAVLAFSGVFDPVLDVTFTSAGTTAYTQNVYLAGNDSTHFLLRTHDSLKVYLYLVTKKYPTQTWQSWGAVDSIGPAAGVYTKSWKGITSAHYAYALKIVSASVDVTSGRARMEVWKADD